MASFSRLRFRPTHRRNGNTLLDVVITLLIISILAAVAAPRFTQAMYRMRADEVAKRVKADLEWARRRATATSKTVNLNFSPNSESYSSPELPDLDNPANSYTVDLSTEPYNGELVSADFGGDLHLAFDRFGQPDSGGTIVIQSGGYQRTITFSSTMTDMAVQ